MEVERERREGSVGVRRLFSERKHTFERKPEKRDNAVRRETLTLLEEGEGGEEEELRERPLLPNVS